ncbi:uncharacterized protein LODBEIA_P06880 [Lodderomyces beijingensis]|uniref:Major facilitator superfamily (MFS) profile domain-containing protein n=1 Tax=Lodderomyces beijingensis TaxID=1775926 RepID=A0ABP0ZE65_9ASCO
MVTETSTSCEVTTGSSSCRDEGRSYVTKPIALKSFRTGTGFESNVLVERDLSARTPTPEAGDNQRISARSGGLHDDESDSSSAVEVNGDDAVVYDKGWKAYASVIGSFLGLVATFGSLNSVGALQAYISVHQLESVSESTVSWIFSMFLAFSFMLCLVTGPLFDSKGSFYPLIFGGIFVFGGLMGVAYSSVVYQFILSLGICVSIGNALCISPLIGVLSHHFKDRIGTMVGIATVGGSVGGMVFPVMLKSLYSKVGFSRAIMSLAFVNLACIGCAVLLCRDRAEVRTSGSGHDNDDEEKDSPKHMSWSQIRDSFEFRSLRDLKYTFLIAGNFATELSLLSMLTYLATYAVAKGMSESDAYTLLTVFNATGIIGRLLPGFLADKLGRYNVMCCMLTGNFLSMFLLWLPFGYDRRVLFAFAALCGMFSSSILTLTPVCLRQISPARKFGARYGLLYLFCSLGLLVGLPASSAIIGTGTSEKYDRFAIFCSVFAVAGTIFWFISRYFVVGLRWNVKV